MSIRKIPTWVAKCNGGCGKKMDSIFGEDVYPIPFYRRDYLLNALERAGWQIEKYDKVYCPSCYKKRQRAKAQVKKNRRRL